MTAHRVLQDIVLARTTGPVDVTGASLTLTSLDHAGRIITLSYTAAASTVTLPAATGSGAVYKFIVAAVNTQGAGLSNPGHRIQVATATDVFEGMIHTISTGDGRGESDAWESGASDDTITLDSTTSGGAAIGDSIEITDYASGKFAVLGFTTTSGTEITPFHANVS